MAEILIISFSNIETDPRVRRQISALSGKHVLTVEGRAGESLKEIRFIPLAPRRRKLMDKVLGAWLLKTRQFQRYYWGLPDVREAIQKLKGKRFNLIIANDVESLPLALRIADGGKVLLDSHEYSPSEFEEKWSWRFFAKRHTTSFLCQEHLPKVNAMMTVCEGIAEKYSRQFGISKPFVIMNAPYYQNLQPIPCKERFSLIHHGTANPSRKLELMIDMICHLSDRFTLDLMLMDDGSGYLEYLKKKASRLPRIRFIHPVAINEIPMKLNSYDIGLYILPPVNLNSSLALPNKFFEFVQARLALAIGPSPEMARYVRRYDLGIVADDFSPEMLAAELNRLTREQVDRFKQNSHKASEELCFEASEKVLIENVNLLLKD